MVEMTRHQKKVVDVAKDVIEYDLGPLELIEYKVEVHDIGARKPKPLVFIYAKSSGNVFVSTTYFIAVHTRGRIDWVKRFFGYKSELKFYTRIFWSQYRRMMADNG